MYSPCNPLPWRNATLPISIFLCLWLIVAYLYFVCILPKPCEFMALSVLLYVCWDQRCSKSECETLLLAPLFCSCPSAEGYHSHSSGHYLSYHQTEPIYLHPSAASPQSLGFVVWICFHWQYTPRAARLALRNEQHFSYSSFHKINPVPWKRFVLEHQRGCSTGVQWTVLKWRISFRNLPFCS